MDYNWSDLVEHILDSSTAASPNSGVPNLDESRSWTDRYSESVWFWTERALTSPAPIVEKMVLFWHGHFCSSLDKVGEIHWMFDQNQIFRKLGLGNFVELTQAVSIDPAMLQYLDNKLNSKGNPNENFSRELMELFTLGVGNYTEQDVRESARAWTGHTIVDDKYVFRSDKHDSANKTFFGVTKNWDGPDIVDHICNGPTQTTVAKFISKKLWSFMAYPNPSTSIVNSLASAFINANMDITALLRAIFNHPSFLSTDAKIGLVKSPIEFALSALKQTGITSKDTNLQWNLRLIGQQPYYPPNVSGWRQNMYWVNTSAVWAKSNFASNIGWKLFNDEHLSDSKSKTPAKAVADSLEFFGIRNASAATTKALINYVEADRADNTWSERHGLLHLPLLTPEFQMA